MNQKNGFSLCFLVLILIGEGKEFLEIILKNFKGLKNLYNFSKFQKNSKASNFFRSSPKTSKISRNSQKIPRKLFWNSRKIPEIPQTPVNSPETPKKSYIF